MSSEHNSEKIQGDTGLYLHINYEVYKSEEIRKKKKSTFASWL